LWRSVPVADGKQPETAEEPITVVTNWQAGLKK
jgi:hypothetical protein